MEAIDVDEIAEVNFPEGREGVEVRFKNGDVRFYSGPGLDGVLEVLNHWTPPTA